jgi:hypothetical protein
MVNRFGEKRHAAKAKAKSEEAVSLSQIRFFPSSSWILMLVCIHMTMPSITAYFFGIMAHY